MKPDEESLRYSPPDPLRATIHPKALETYDACKLLIDQGKVCPRDGGALKLWVFMNGFDNRPKYNEIYVDTVCTTCAWSWRPEDDEWADLGDYYWADDWLESEPD